MKWILILTTGFFLSLIHEVSAGDIFHWVDDKGVKHFTETPPPDSCKTTSCIEIRQLYFNENQIVIDEHNDRLRKEKEEKEKVKTEREKQKKIDEENEAKYNSPENVARRELEWTHLLEGTYACFRLQDRETLGPNMLFGLGFDVFQQNLMLTGKCVKLGHNIRYKVLDLINIYVKVQVVEKGEIIELWVTTSDVPHGQLDFLR
ncbi:DUF4124 domain-containing protein [Shewanella baltica]|uniref:DUF4124 domain-containing protein n=1 Tax=Shewanella baltica TaxID=62322 RepID=UPI00217D671B|nr:DUF4124 domain-containing protein [Shewanella baltica]MCS6153660.1 DUF4124 domain-containing protein [Shewanella baltica]